MLRPPRPEADAVMTSLALLEVWQCGSAPRNMPVSRTATIPIQSSRALAPAVPSTRMPALLNRTSMSPRCAKAASTNASTSKARYGHGAAAMPWQTGFSSGWRLRQAFRIDRPFCTSGGVAHGLSAVRHIQAGPTVVTAQAPFDAGGERFHARLAGRQIGLERTPARGLLRPGVPSGEQAVFGLGLLVGCPHVVWRKRGGVRVRHATFQQGFLCIETRSPRLLPGLKGRQRWLERQSSSAGREADRRQQDHGGQRFHADGLASMSTGLGLPQAMPPGLPLLPPSQL